ncbi:tRNA pseudouridine(38-40) synthase TruA [Demequina sp.]|uniref:tRNA pseudouridine(38-40) synthase TruA n=1 Tax=Demequina sp. TaxID=2050685 RepID=UPI003D0ABE47
MTESVVRARLVFAYDGTDFAGWAAQPALRTVQGELEGALEQVTRVPSLRVTVAGRTDAGVHARGQQAHVDLPVGAWERMPGRSDRSPADGLLTRLNGVLPQDIRIFAVTEAPDGFDARFAATERRYIYRVTDTIPDPLNHRYVLAHDRSLDVGLLNAASGMVTGLRDFAAFCRGREGATTIRTLHEFSWARADSGVIEATVRADAFCHSMVRSLVGALLVVGDGRRDVAWLQEVAASSSRSQAIWVAPPYGLTLEEVGYPPDTELSARAEVTRARRVL